MKPPSSTLPDGLPASSVLPTPDEGAALRLESVARLKHDLGKAVAWISAHLDEAAFAAPLRSDVIDALTRDLLATRRRGEEVTPAWAVWEELGGPALARQVPELVAVEQAVSILRAARPVLVEGDPEALGRIASELRRAQLQIRTALRDAHQRLVAEARSEPPTPG